MVERKYRMHLDDNWPFFTQPVFGTQQRLAMLWFTKVTIIQFGM
jgi:hypothetical protein